MQRIMCSQEVTPDGGGCGSHAAPSSTPITVARAPRDIPTMSPGHRTAQTSCATPACSAGGSCAPPDERQLFNLGAASMTGIWSGCRLCLPGSRPGRGRIPATACSPAAMMVYWPTAAEARHRQVPRSGPAAYSARYVRSAMPSTQHWLLSLWCDWALQADRRDARLK